MVLHAPPIPGTENLCFLKHRLLFTLPWRFYMRSAAHSKIPARCWALGLVLYYCLLCATQAAQFRNIVIHISERATEVERNSAALLAERIAKPSGISVHITNAAKTVFPSKGEL